MNYLQMTFEKCIPKDFKLFDMLRHSRVICHLFCFVLKTLASLCSLIFLKLEYLVNLVLFL